MNVVFTIVAKNYLASAITLGKSVQKFNKNCDFVIFLADRAEAALLEKIEFPVYEAEKFNIPNFEQQSFMYDVVELSTAVKPYFMLYLMNEKEYNKVIYLDPDTWVMDSLDLVFEQLEKWDFVLTPHIVDMNNAPNKKEAHILDRGVFNLGFLGARNTDTSQRFLYWWKERLEIYCFRDNQLFVDQKWVTYLPVFSDNYYVIRSKAYNMADWNYSEREIMEESGRYYINDEGRKESLKFFHFSGIKLESPDIFFRKHGIEIEDNQRKILTKLITEYQQELIRNGYKMYSNLPYEYGRFSNGDKIELIHRRIYRKNKERISQPFSADSGNFYRILKKEKLLSNRKEKSSGNKGKIDNEPEGNLEKKVGWTVKGKIFIGLMKLMIRIFGINNYMQLLKQMKVGLDINEQSFLINEYLNKNLK